MNTTTLDYAEQNFSFGANEILLGAGHIQQRLADAWGNRIFHAYPPGYGVPVDVRERMQRLWEDIHGDHQDARDALLRMNVDDTQELVNEVVGIRDDLAAAIAKKDNHE